MKFSEIYMKLDSPFKIELCIEPLNLVELWNYFFTAHLESCNGANWKVSYIEMFIGKCNKNLVCNFYCVNGLLIQKKTLCILSWIEIIKIIDKGVFSRFYHWLKFLTEGVFSLPFCRISAVS